MARKSNLEERIVSIINGPHGRERLTRRRTLLTGWLAVILLLVPLTCLQIFAQAPSGSEERPVAGAAVERSATMEEREAILALLSDFHEALYDGDDYLDIADRFLTADFFDEPGRTFENWTRERRDMLMRNTLGHLRSVVGDPPDGRSNNIRLKEPLTIAGSSLVYRAEVVACSKQGDEYYLRHRVNISSAHADEPRYLVRDHEQTIVFAKEGGEFRIRRYDGGINVQRMDTDNPHGPIFIVTLDRNEQTIPTGPLLFKSIPRSIVPNATSMIPLRAESTDR